MEKRIQEAVDRLLLEQGAYVPLELLLAEGRLFYEDYEQWRQGGAGCLEESLFGDPRQIHELLQQAADYALALGLISEQSEYMPWHTKDEPLRFSLEPSCDRLFFTHYRKPSDIPQLDLFMDATGTNLANGVVVALVSRDKAEARSLLDQLFDCDPGNSRLGGLERLLEIEEGARNPPQEPAVALEVLEHEIEPLAQELLGPGCRDYLVPHWQRIGQALANHPFDPAAPKLHASYPALRGEAWSQLRSLVETEPSWGQQPLLLRRHAQACGRLREEIDEACDWFRLCWYFPDQAGHMNKEASPTWRARWKDFIELEPELPDQDFPAWSLLQEPGLVKGLEAAPCLEGAEPPRGYRLIAELVAAAVAKVPVNELIEARKQLQEVNPALFQHYLQRFGGG